LYIEILTQRVGTQISKHLNFCDLKVGVDQGGTGIEILDWYPVSHTILVGDFVADELYI